MDNPLEEGNALVPDFSKIARVAELWKDCIPVVVQDIDSGDVLVLGYTTEAIMRQAFAERALILWSTSRGKVWRKGAVSGNSYELVEAYINCEQNSLLYKVRAKGGGMCHTADADGTPRKSCYYRKIELDTLTLTKL